MRQTAIATCCLFAGKRVWLVDDQTSPRDGGLTDTQVVGLFESLFEQRMTDRFVGVHMEENVDD